MSNDSPIVSGLSELINQETLLQFRDEFLEISNDQMTKGSEYEKGPIPGWLKNDLFKFVYEELADLANYSLLLYTRLRVLEELLRANGIDLSTVATVPDEGSGLPSGPGTFISTEDIS